MMRKTLLGAMLLTKCFVAPAQTTDMTCVTVPRILGELTLIACDTSNEVTVAEYRSKKLSSPFATDLDQRRVSVAVSKNGDALTRRAGLKKTKQRLRLESSKLADIPESDSILRREVDWGVKKYHRWSIYKEFLQYAAQGNTPGYPMKCETAIINQDQPKYFLIASECHDFSDKNFTKILDDIESIYFNRKMPAKQQRTNADRPN